MDAVILIDVLDSHRRMMSRQRLTLRTAGPPLLVGGELNKVASNIATGRNHAGIHWRSDAVESFKLGEACAIAILQDQLATLNEGGSFQFTKFDGTPIVIS